jgi:asparagine synthase (glutamine-hydrolysing)
LSIIFGIVNRDGTPLPATASGRFGGRTVNDGTAALGESSERNCVLFRDPAGNLFLAAGSVDNRRELAGELGLPLGNAGDGELLWDAWRRWGDESPGHIQGRWIIAVWNPAERRLFVARDRAGNSVLYYHENPRFFAFSTSRRALMSLDLPKLEMDELLLAQLLVSWPSSTWGQTMHVQIRSLLPGHVLSVRAERVEVRRYWHLEATPELVLRRRCDYIPAFFDVFEGAVRRCLPENGSVAATLSGGLDSGSVSIVAARCLA